ncbi:MAG: hypothetical protein JXA71_11275 [Chitinispirillaceae bacterium]|nr:hypothetical protein [Chitinispirillaceae bacterium]
MGIVRRKAGIVWSGLFFIIGCAGTSDPEITNVSPLGSIYVAYPSPDSLARRDTLTLSFDYTSSTEGPIEVRATLDSGRTWVGIGAVTTNGSNKGTVTWVPKEAPAAVIEFFGQKECYLQIRDASSNVYVNSDTFLLYGSLAVELTRPSGAATFGINDTIRIEYTQNQDISGFFSVYFRSDAMADWVLVTERTERVDQFLPFKYFVTLLVPQDFVEEVNRLGGENFREPIKILVADYQQNSMAYSDAITIIP